MCGARGPGRWSFASLVQVWAPRLVPGPVFGGPFLPFAWSSRLGGAEAVCSRMSGVQICTVLAARPRAGTAGFKLSAFGRCLGVRGIVRAWLRPWTVCFVVGLACLLGVGFLASVGVGLLGSVFCVVVVVAGPGMALAGFVQAVLPPISFS